MKDTNIERQKTVSKNEIKDRCSDFTIKYFAVYHLQRLAETHPEIIDPETVFTLEGLLKDPGFSRQRKGFFLFRLAADTLASIIVHSDGEPMPGQALASLKGILAKTTGHAHRVSAEALGALPFSISGPDLEQGTAENIPSVNWHDLLGKNGLELSASAAFMGRSLVAPLNPGNKLLVFKLARAEDSPGILAREALWMEHLHTVSSSFPRRFNIPVPIKIQGDYVFSIKDIPVRPHENMHLDPKCHAMGFVADQDYFTYPNDPRIEKRHNDAELREVMYRNAWLLGKLTSLGIVHTAPIPLFHNRVQRCRRRDNGLYEWFRAGRLDRWLDSCSYPNIGLTGIRDFEHFISFKGFGRDLYRHIGSHMLSLLLVTGSYFRNKNTSKVGFDKHGKPVDARDLFDKRVLKEIILGVFLSYYQGFVQREFSGKVPVDLDKLASRMIEEMGVDRHMEEILRIADQKEMTDDQFRHFLRQRGYHDEEINELQREVKDIVIHSGPHLGAFNEGISLPELIESVETMSALCITGRYWSEHLQSSLIPDVHQDPLDPLFCLEVGQME